MKKTWARVSKVVLLAVGCLTTVLACSEARTANLDTTLSSLLADAVKKDSSVKNCVLSLASGDGAFSWSGAAGVSSGQTTMTKDTPI